MTCRELVEFLMDYVENELGAEERGVFEAHLGECPTCVDYVESYRETVRLGETLCEDPDGPLPADVPEQLVRGILAARKAGSRS